jgi:NTE family protein
MVNEPRLLSRAVVLSGGGAKGGYEVGVMKALFNGKSPATGFEPLEVEIFTGASVGAYNAAFLASQPDSPAAVAVGHLEEVWRDQFANTPEKCGNGVFRLRGLPLQGFDPGCLLHPVKDFTDLVKDGAFFANYALVRAMNITNSQIPFRNRIAETIDLSALFSTAPLYSLVQDTLDLNRLRASQKKLIIIASNFRDGTIRLFSKEDITDRYGAEAILASAAVPIIFPPVSIDDTPYVDGGVLNNTPLRPAIRLGADVIHVIYLDPFVDEIPFPTLPNTLDYGYRIYAILVNTNINNDISTANDINRSLIQVQAGGLTEAGPGNLLRGASRIAQREQEGRRYRVLTIHRYRPTSDLGGGEGLLDFSQDNIDYLISLGYSDAVNHDCTASGCVFPESV